MSKSAIYLEFSVCFVPKDDLTDKDRENNIGDLSEETIGDIAGALIERLQAARNETKGMTVLSYGPLFSETLGF